LIRLLLGGDNLPTYVPVFGKLGAILLFKVPFDWISGSFRIWPPQLFQADSIPQNELFWGSNFFGRIKVAARTQAKLA
jgi:hypothetical protein